LSFFFKKKKKERKKSFTASESDKGL